jgi:hypothetical protein
VGSIAIRFGGVSRCIVVYRAAVSISAPDVLSFHGRNTFNIVVGVDVLSARGYMLLVD